MKNAPVQIANKGASGDANHHSAFRRFIYPLGSIILDVLLAMVLAIDAFQIGRLL